MSSDIDESPDYENEDAELDAEIDLEKEEYKREGWDTED